MVILQSPQYANFVPQTVRPVRVLQAHVPHVQILTFFQALIACKHVLILIMEAVISV